MRATAIPFDENWRRDTGRGVLRPMMWVAALGFSTGFCGYLALIIPALTAG